MFALDQKNKEEQLKKKKKKKIRYDFERRNSDEI